MFARFCDTLNTPGGHIIALFVCIIIGAVMAKFGVQMREGLLHDAFIALLAILAPRAAAAVLTPPGANLAA